MEIHHLKIFVSVYKNRSFTRASELLHISQPTISEHVKNLESSLNCKLFDRLGRSIMPTREADVLFPKAVKLLDDLGRILEEVAATGTGIRGSLQIGASTIPGSYILPVEAHAFKQLYPDVSFEILIEDSARITEMVLRHDLLCGIVGAIMEPGRLDYLPVVEDELILVASPGMKLKKNVSLKDLEQIPFLLREKGSGTRQTTENHLNKKQTDLNRFTIVATLGSTSSIKQAAKAGLGAAILSRIAVREELADGILREIPINGLRIRRSFYLVRRKNRTLPAQYQAFCDHLLQSATAA